MKTVSAYIKNVRVTPKKLRFIVPEIKKEPVSKALSKLNLMNKKPAQFLYKAIKSCVDNAKNKFKVEENMLKFKTIVIEEGFKLKRYRAGSRGRAKPYTKRFSHIKIELEVLEPKTK
ncbi:MAG: 50S ribosomal protein L22 [Patescibacteria group bacterium]|nr:MAG: 50S ribosomal protein L22 [Patescibacteria group bacterium]